MPTTPEIRIAYSWLLAKSVAEPWIALRNQQYNQQLQFPSPEWIEERISQYRSAWQQKQQVILENMQNVFGLSFYLPVIDCAICPMVQSISTPLIINTRTEPDEFIDILTHELLHILLYDNKEGFKPSKLQDELAPSLTQRAKNHIFVHAGLQYIYVDVLKEPRRLERDISQCAKAPDYHAAWEVVKNVGYGELTKKIRAAAKQP